MSTYAIAESSAPLYNTPDFPHFQPTLEKKRDHQGLLKSIEIIVFPHTKFTIIKEISPTVSEVTTADYPSSTPLYVDSRFLQRSFKETTDRYKTLPPAAVIIKFMQSVVGVRYFWGGNCAHGIPEMAKFYPQLTAPEDQDDAVCKGLDCSGLLYEATGGFTPRNTSQLMTYGNELNVDQNSPEEVQKIVKPLDMMVWRGHVIFVLDSEHTIECALGRGVIISDFKERYSYFLEKLRAEKKPFSLRRWHPDFLT